MFKKITVVGVICCCLGSFIGISYAQRFLNKQEAFNKVFGPGVEIVTENKELIEPKLSEARKRLGGSLDFIQKGKNIEVKKEETKFDFYFALKDGKKNAVALITSEPGKWGPIEFIVVLDLQGAVTKIEVMNYEEKRGRPIAGVNYLKQYFGKNGRSALEVGKDINGISGATISSRCATFIVKKAIVLYEELYLKQ